MTLTNLHKTPWPWYGGKADAAEAVWSALGDPEHYVEPFAGSLAVLLRRPATANRCYYSETVNDLDGLLVNAWRAMIHAPDAMAEAASWPVTEADVMARHLALLAWRRDGGAERLMADPDYFDAKMAGWWVYGQSAWIGSGWCSGDGSWIVGDDGRITKRPKSGGVARQRPFVGSNGQGVHRAGAREEGVARQIPHVSKGGQGVHHPGAREEGVGAEPDYHPMTMPEVLRWFRFLSARLRHVRVLNGDWQRAVTSGVLKTLSVRQGGTCGVFLDPPYADTADRATVYAHDSMTVAHDVREWAIANGHDPRYRIVLAGFDGEHVMPADWTEVEWFRAGFLKGGMGQQGKDGHQQHRERLWLSPHCIRPAAAPAQGLLW